jgi:tRNA A37 methylthiotransferase MiaB
LIDVIKKNNNICKQIHLPAQSGSSKVLKNMRRYYTREAYLNLVEFIRNKMPYIALSSDFIAGFCEESDDDFNETITLLEEVKYEMAFLFAYSMREKTHAYHNLKDNVSEELKKIRLNKMIDVFKKHQLDKNKDEIGKYHLVLVEGFDRKSNSKLVGRTDTNKLCIFNNEKVYSEIPNFIKEKFSDINLNDECINKSELKKGDYAIVRVDDCSNNTLFCSGVAYVKSMKQFFEISEGKPFIELSNKNFASHFNLNNKL